MVLYQMKYTIDKDKVDAYTKLAKEAVTLWLSMPGLKEFRAYREPYSLNALVEAEFDSFVSWGKAAEDPKIRDVMTKLIMYVHDDCWTLWDKSPVVPEPLKPKK